MTPEDFIRRIPKPIPQPRGEHFRCRGEETGISVTARQGDLLAQDGLIDYQNANVLPQSRNFPALWLGTRVDIEGVELELVYAPLDGVPFGDRHWETTSCPDEDQSEQIARRVAARGGPLLPFRKKA